MVLSSPQFTCRYTGYTALPTELPVANLPYCLVLLLELYPGFVLSGITQLVVTSTKILISTYIKVHPGNGHLPDMHGMSL